MKKILLTGGGSGGHIFPLVAIAEHLKENPDVELRYYGPKDIYSGYLIKLGILVKHITPSKFRRYFDWQNFTDLPKFIFSIFQAIFKIYWFMPDVVFSKGGPGALPVLLACRFYLIPVIIHESDSVPGLTNKISGKFAKKIELAFENAKKYFPNKNLNVAGNPVRRELFEYLSYDPGISKKRLGIETDKPLIFILGGSLGSVRINDFIESVVNDLLKKYQIIHQTGTANYQKLKDKQKPGYKIAAFLESKDYGEIMAASDLVISRAGAGAIFEIAAFGKPSILIPLPEAAGDHQRTNAYAYSQNGAAEVIEEPNLGKVTLGVINKILSDSEKYQQMRKAALDFAKPEAAKTVAEDILNI